jgi:hypothetical protein
MSNAGSAFLAYFYFDFKDTAKQDSRALLSSLLVQLSDQSDIFFDTLFFFFFFFLDQFIFRNTSQRLSPVVATSRYI